MPRIGEYFGKLFSVVPERGADPVPVLALPHLLGGVKQTQSLAYWFYRIGTYATLLWQTVQMAVLATVMGSPAPSSCRFPPRAIWSATAPSSGSRVACSR